MPNARLCAYDFPSGKACRQVALKDEALCRHHMAPHRHGMYEITHDEAMDRLQQKLNALELPDLLRLLQAKLNNIKTTVRSHPEAQLTLNAALDRLRFITTGHSQQSTFTETPAPPMN